MPRTDLPRYDISLTLSEAQLDRLDEMIERYNATRNPSHPAVLEREQMLLIALNTLEPVLFPNANLRGVFER